MSFPVKLLVRSGAGVAGVAILAAWLVGCGGDDSSKTRVVVRNPQRHMHTPTPKVVPARSVQTPTPKPLSSRPVQTPALEESAAMVAQSPEPLNVVTYPEVTYEAAEAAFLEKRYEDATVLFTRYTERKNGNPWGFYMLGLSAHRAGQHERAETAFEHALELDPKHVKSRLNLSRVLLDQGRPEDALVQAREAAAIDPQSNVAYRLKGRVFHEIGQLSQAIESYRRAIRIDNQDAWSMNNLGLIYIEQGRFGMALPPLARAVELGRDNAMFLNNLGMALESIGHFRVAESTYQNAVTVDESYAKASANLERVALVLENPGLETIDLSVIARSFVDEIGAGGGGVVVSIHGELIEPEVGSEIDRQDEAGEPGESSHEQSSTGESDGVIAVSDADSTRSGSDR